MDDVDLPGAEGDVLGGGGSEPVLEKDGGDVVCPLSVLAQWRDEAARHIRSGRRTLLVHYDKRLSPADLAGADIVLTTYGVVVAEHGAAQGGGVFGVKWRRIVLDEGHVIKQRSTHAAKAVCLLDAERRWVLTGTPLSNTIEDIYPLVRRESPWSDFPVFSAAFLRPQATTPQAQGVFPAPRPGRAEEAAEDVMSRLRGVLRGVMLRRTVHTLNHTGVPILSLPKRSTTTEILSFSAYEQDFYGALMQRSQTKFDQYMSAGKVLSNYASILEMLLRLRQACAHPYLALARPSGDADREKLARQLLEDADANGSKINCSNVLLDADASPGDTTASPGDVTGVASTEGGHVGDKADGDADSVVHGVGNTSESVKGCDAGEGSSRGYFRGVSESVRSGVVPDCPICLEPCVEPMITPCAHIFCRDCAYRALPKEPRAVSRAVPGVKSSFPGRGPASELGGALGAVGAVEAGGGGRCPVCRKALGRGDLRVLPRAGRFSVNLKESWRPSSKVDALIRDLRRVRAGAPPLGFALSDDLLLAAGNVDVDGAGNVDVKGAGDVKGPGGVEGIVGAASDVGREGRGGQGGAGNVDAEGAENVDVEGAGDVKGAGSVEGGREHAGGRSVVFSQWTSLLDILEVALEREEMPFVRFDGSMSSEKRAAALRRVEEPGGPKILLMSLKAGGVGLNLVYVRHCFLMDLWWNPQMEEQAIGRIHRIGQTHQVFVKRYLIRGSVEERILQMQIRKQSLTNSAIGGGVVPGGAKPDGAARVRELSMLFKT
ncbi:P-loop containing nucleoside triphosphate hydrolase protein [Baffinella frigidus]|nr:P-loop containing nucleoside triphosphate hydrolase protein [Cryptophyta sp. CCMP2293]